MANLIQHLTKLLEKKVGVLPHSLVRECLYKEVFLYDQLINFFEYVDTNGILLEGEALKQAQRNDDFYELYTETEKPVTFWYEVSEDVAILLEKYHYPLLRSSHGTWAGWVDETPPSKPLSLFIVQNNTKKGRR